MAEIFEPGATFDALAARQRTAVSQTLRQTQANVPRDDQQISEPTAAERSLNIRTDAIRRGRQLQQFQAARDLQVSDNTRAFNRTIDQHGNEVRLENEQTFADRRVEQQRLAETALERNRRIDERKARDQEFLAEQRIQEQLAQQRIDQSTFDASLPRGTIVDLLA